MPFFRFRHSGIQAGDGADDEDSFLGPGSDDVQRRYLLQQSAFGAQVISLPTPWITPNGQEMVELLIKKHCVYDELYSPMTIGDPMINSVLAYINMGAIYPAQRLVDIEQAQRML